MSLLRLGGPSDYKYSLSAYKASFISYNSYNSRVNGSSVCYGEDPGIGSETRRTAAPPNLGIQPVKCLGISLQSMCRGSLHIFADQYRE